MVLLFCYFCSSFSLTPSLSRNPCTFFVVVFSGTFQEEKKSNQKKKRKKKESSHLWKLYKTNTILNKITLEFWGTIDVFFFAGEVTGFTLWTTSSCSIASSHTNKLSWGPWPQRCLNDHLSALINWRTSKFMSRNQWNSSQWEKVSNSRCTIHASWIATPSALQDIRTADPCFHSTSTLATSR